MKILEVISILLLSLSLLLLCTLEARAYLDPGSGSYMMQVLLASLIGGLYILKVYFKRIVERIKGLIPKKARVEDE